MRMKNRKAQSSRSNTDVLFSAGKRRLFTVAMILIPVMFFGLLEGVLRLFGYGDVYPLFIPVENYPEYLYQNHEVARRYFTRIENIPTSLTDFFTAKKDPGTFRIFVQGGSSAAGFPFYYGGSFSRMLEQRLLQTFPGRPIEVVNTAMAAVNSYTMLDFAEEIIAHEPDAVLIYAGHNEYYGALGVGSSESLGRIRLVTTAYLQLLNFRTVQALRDLLVNIGGWISGRERGETPTGTLMEGMVGEQKIPYGSQLYFLGLNQFRSNLSALLERYRQHGIPVFIGTLASNERDFRPFITGLSPATDARVWQAKYDEGIAAAAHGDTTAAILALEAAMMMDSLSASAFYVKGQLLEQSGRYVEARTAYLAAKDRDELRFRAPEVMNGIIREEAARYGAVVVEIQVALSAVSPHGIIGSNVMTEHLHPNVDGYFRVADAFYEALRRQNKIGDWSNPIDAQTARSELLLTPVDSLAGIFRVRRLMAAWPFQPPGVVDQAMLASIRATNPVEGIALDLINKDVRWVDANIALRRYYEARGDFHRALQAALVHIQEYPFADTPYLAAGDIFLRQGRFDEALTYYIAADERQESVGSQRMIGTILLQRGQHEAAIEHLERAFALNPEEVHVLYNLSGAYALTQQYHKARQVVNRLLQLAPDHEGGLRLLNDLAAY